MGKQRINYEIENRETILADIAASGFVIEHDATLYEKPEDIAGKRYTECYFVVETDPSPQMDTDQIIAEQAARIADMRAALAELGVNVDG
jgi:hypothetical protein